MFANINFVLKYPSIDMIIQKKIKDLGPKKLLFKIDLERAVHNFCMDPFDYPVLGLRWNAKNYVDLQSPIPKTRIQPLRVPFINIIYNI